MGILMWWVVACDYVIVYVGLSCNYELHLSTLRALRLEKGLCDWSSDIVKYIYQCRKFGRGFALFHWPSDSPDVKPISICGTCRTVETPLWIRLGSDPWMHGHRTFWVDRRCLAPACFLSCGFSELGKNDVCQVASTWKPGPKFSQQNLSLERDDFPLCLLVLCNVVSHQCMYIWIALSNNQFSRAFKSLTENEWQTCIYYSCCVTTFSQCF